MSFTKSLSFKHAVVAAMIIALSPACLEKHTNKVKVESDEDKIAYTLGYNFGDQIAKNTESLNVDTLISGVMAGFAKEDGKLDEEARQTAMNSFRDQRREVMKRKQDAAGAENKTKGETYLAANKAKEGVVTTESGLQYKVITAGEGKSPSADDKVSVHYKGTLVDGTEFDSSHKRGKPANFPVKGVIKGWTEALQLMKVGAKWELYIPSDLAYGPRGPGKIGPDATLIFEVELLEIVAQ